MPRRDKTTTAAASSSCLVQLLHHRLSLSQLDKAVNALPVLARRGLRPDLPTVTSLLYRCLRSGSLALARRVHLHLKLTGFKRSIPACVPLANLIVALHFECGRSDDARALFDKMPSRNVFSYNAMLAGYAKLGFPAAARRIFERMGERDVVSWNTMIVALSRGGLWREAIGCYSRMRRSFDGFNPYTFSAVLVANVGLRQVGLTRQLHGQVLVIGLLTNVIISSSLLDAYAKCKNMECAKKLFDEMPVQDVCAWTALVSGYAKCGDLLSARELFNEMPEKNQVSWSAMISGYVQSGHPEEALDVFVKMLEEGAKPDQFAFSSTLSACTTIPSLKHGKQVHCYLTRRYYHPNVVTLSSLIDMYSKCGDLISSWRIFDLASDDKRETVLWNTMISAFGRHGHGVIAMKLFDKMTKAGLVLDSNTFIVILTACSHSGLVSKGIDIFESMAREYGIVPKEEHHACFVDLLARAGRLEEVKEWIQKSPYRTSAVVWKALLGGCRVHGNLELGIEAAELLIELEPGWSAAYVLLANMYADMGRWDSAKKVRSLMEMGKVKKEKAMSSLEVNNEAHSFGVADQLHPMMTEVHALNAQLSCVVKDDVSIT